MPRPCSGNTAFPLTGIGGCGKKRLALALAQKVIEDFPDGAWFVDLAPLTDDSRVPDAIAAVLGVSEAPGRELVDVVCDHVANKNLLLVLDNCEHLIQACADVADRLLRGAASLRIVATGREALAVEGERVVVLKPLTVPSAAPTQDLGVLQAAESVRLFADRARLGEEGFAITEGNAATVADICRRLDGIPLAIELAAARTKVLSVEQIRARLDDRFRLLSGSSRTVLPRHQTLRATIQWSYDQLSVEEQRLFRRFSIFAGGWTLSSATKLAGDASDEFAVLETIEHLADKSLTFVQYDDSVAEETRYGMLETVRQYGRERLAEAGEFEGARLRHLEMFTALAEAGYSERASREGFWARTLEADHDNLRTALDTARDRDPREYLLIAGALAWFWQARSHLIEGRGHVTAALAAAAGSSPSTEARARALWGLGLMVGWQGDAAASLRYMEEALGIWRSLGNLAEVALALEGIGWVQCVAGADEQAEATFLECLRLQTDRGDPILVNRARVGLAQTYVALSKVEDARRLATEVIASRRAGGSAQRAFRVAFPRRLRTARSDIAASLPLYQKSLQLARAMGDRLETSFEVQGAGMSLAGLGGSRTALHLVSAAKAEWQRMGVDLQIRFWNVLLDTYLAKAREGMDCRGGRRGRRARTAFDDVVAIAAAARA